MVTANARRSRSTCCRSVRAISSGSLGQIRASQNCNIGKIENRKANQTARPLLIGSNNAGNEIAKNESKKYPQRAYQIIKHNVATSTAMSGSGGADRLRMPNQIKIGATTLSQPTQTHLIRFIAQTCISSPIAC